MSQSPDQNASNVATASLQRYRDGWSALSHLIGQGKSFSGNERNCFFLNNGNGKFSQAATAFGLDLNDDARAIATTDWNFDGAPDIWLTNRTAPRVKLMLNSANSQKWLRLYLRGTQSNRDAIGARVTVYLKDSTTKLIRTVRAGDGFLSQSSRWQHFGLGDSDVHRVEVRWPNGESQSFTGIQTNCHFKLKEGDALADRWTPPTVSLESDSSTSANVAVDDTTTRTWLMGRVPLIHPQYVSGSEAATTDRFLGKPLLIALWSKTCQPCLKELAEWSREQNQFHEADCRLLALSVDNIAEGQVATATVNGKEDILSRIGWPFENGQATTQFVDGLEMLQRTFVEWQQPLPVPSSFLLDEQGRLVAIYRGAQDLDVILADLKNLSAPGEQQRNAAVPFPGKWASLVFTPDPTPVVRTFEVTNRENLIGGYLERYIRLSPQPEDRTGIVKACVLLVTRLIEEEQYGELEFPLLKLREVAPDLSQVHRQVATQLLRAGRGRESLTHFEIAISANEEDSVLLHNAGLAAISKRDFSQAIDLLRRSANLDPEDAATYFHLGNAQQFLNDASAAIESYKRAHRLRPKWSLPANNLAWLLSTNENELLRDGELALRTIEPFCKNWQDFTQPSEVALLGTYVAALAETGDFDTALQVNSKIVKMTQNKSNRARLLQRQQLLQRRRPIREAL